MTPETTGSSRVFDLIPLGPEVARDAVHPLAQSGGQLAGAIVADAVCTWLIQRYGQLVLLMWPRAFRARFNPLAVVDDHGQLVAIGGKFVTVAGSYLKPGDARSLGYELAFAAWKASPGQALPEQESD